MRSWAGWYAARPGRLPGRHWSPAAAGRAGLQGRARRPRQGPPVPARLLGRQPEPSASRSGPTRPPCPCGRCRPAKLAVTLFQMIESGDGPAAFLRRRHPGRLVPGPSPPPAGPARRRRRLPRPGSTPGGWGDALGRPCLGELGRRLRPPRRNPGARTRLRYHTPACKRLGPRARRPRASLADADAWYFILEGTREADRRRSRQAMAHHRASRAHAATAAGTEPRAAILLGLPTTTPPCPARVPRCGSSTSGAGPWASASRCVGAVVGTALGARTRTSGTASPGTGRRRQSGCCAPPSPSPSPSSPGTRPRRGDRHQDASPGCGATKGPSRVQHTWTADPQIAPVPWTPARPATSTPEPAPGPRSPAPGPSPLALARPRPRPPVIIPPAARDRAAPASCPAGPATLEMTPFRARRPG